MSDVTELSVQRIAIEDGAGDQVSGNAWVVVENCQSGTPSREKEEFKRRPFAFLLQRFTEGCSAGQPSGLQTQVRDGLLDHWLLQNGCNYLQLAWKPPAMNDS